MRILRRGRVSYFIYCSDISKGHRHLNAADFNQKIPEFRALRNFKSDFRVFIKRQNWLHSWWECAASPSFHRFLYSCSLYFSIQFSSNPVLHKFYIVPSRHICVGSYIFSARKLDQPPSTTHTLCAFSVILQLEKWIFWFIKIFSFVSSIIFFIFLLI